MQRARAKRRCYPQEAVENRTRDDRDGKKTEGKKGSPLATELQQRNQELSLVVDVSLWREGKGKSGPSVTKGK